MWLRPTAASTEAEVKDCIDRNLRLDSVCGHGPAQGQHVIRAVKRSLTCPTNEKQTMRPAPMYHQRCVYTAREDLVNVKISTTMCTLSSLWNLPLTKVSAKRLFLFHQTWKMIVVAFRCFSLSLSLYKYEFGDVWVNHDVGDEKTFLREFKERVVSFCKQEWNNSLRTKQRFTVYSIFKSSLFLAPYLYELKNIKATNFFNILRLCVSPLRTHKLSYRKNLLTILSLFVKMT